MFASALPTFTAVTTKRKAETPREEAEWEGDTERELRRERWGKARVGLSVAQKPQLLMNGNGFVGNGVLAIMLPACLASDDEAGDDEAQR